MEHNLYQVSQGSYERVWVPKVLFAQCMKQKFTLDFPPSIGLRWYNDNKHILKSVSFSHTDLQYNYEQCLTP
jgi:hypothetical protein